MTAPSVLCTFPGRYGDLLWALPTLRALSRRLGQPVDLLIAGEFAAILPLLREQPYLGWVMADPDWTDHAGPPSDLRTADHVYYLGHAGWPQRPLPFHTLDRLNAQALPLIRDVELDLDTPWITVEGPGAPVEIAGGFTEAWFELKLGLAVALERLAPTLPIVYLTQPGTRWVTEVPPGVIPVDPIRSWVYTARTLRNADLFFGDCSALHVLAVALGKRVVLMEPMEGRWNPIFYPLGTTGRVHLITGNDGKPTFDARHCADALLAAMGVPR